MKATYWQPGNQIDFVNETSETIPANTVISLGTRIGVAGTDIEPNSKGSIITEGVFILTKTEASTKINLGDKLCFDGTGIIVETEENIKSPENIPAGWAIQASLANEPTVYVKIC